MAIWGRNICVHVTLILKSRVLSSKMWILWIILLCHTSKIVHWIATFWVANCEFCYLIQIILSGSAIFYFFSERWNFCQFEFRKEEPVFNSYQRMHNRYESIFTICLLTTQRNKLKLSQVCCYILVQREKVCSFTLLTINTKVKL